jgi:flagellar hook-basal body complex protein FliE
MINGINSVYETFNNLTRVDGAGSFEKINFSPNFEALERPDNSGAFKSIYDSFLNMIEKTAENQAQAADFAVRFAAGETDDMLAVILAQEIAYASLNFAAALSNKLIASYREILAIQL